MCHNFHSDPTFYRFLLEVDQDIAAEVQAGGCSCGGVLHSARYPRKPRGIRSALDESYSTRLSFCCAEDDCRRRTTPPSVRFLGRKVYLGVMVLLMTAMRHGLSARRRQALIETLDVSPQTLWRWCRWWQESGSIDHSSENLEPCMDSSQTGRSALQSVLSAGADDLPTDVFETVAEALGTQSQSRAVTLLPTVQEYLGNWQQGKQLLAQAKGHSAKLSTRLQGLVQAHTLTRQRTVRRGRALSQTHLHRIAVGDSRVFTRRDQRTAPNTAIHLLVDLSGSMAGGNSAVALEAAMALALALEPIQGTSCAVTAFPGVGGSEAKVTRILGHEDRVSSRGGAFVQSARGSTPMTGALWFAASDLITRREDRKVILTLTDGGPDDWETATEVIGKATGSGIEIIGIGIRQDVSRLFPVAIRIASVDELKGELFRIAEQLLLS